MEIKQMIRKLNSFYPLSEELKRTLLREATKMSLPRHHEILKAPAVETSIMFIAKGLVEMYSFRNGRKCVTGFYKAGDIVVDLRSFMHQVSSQYTIKLLEKSQIVCISYEQAMRYGGRFLESGFIFSGIVSEKLEQMEQFYDDLRTMSAMKRLSKLLTSYPKIEQRASQDSIASYLGIAPQSLSRIKRIQHDRKSKVKSTSEPHPAQR
jgi:CRP-like cAMP-binding protein